MEHFYQKLGEDWFSYPNLYRGLVANAIDGMHFVEVGSWKGRSAAFMAVEIFNSGKKIKFDCVDIWKKAIDYTDLNHFLAEGDDWLYELFLKNIEPVKHIITPVRMDSDKASNLYADGQLDFVFIDAAHNYENVIKDIKCWFPKVKEGGIIAGHDYGIFPGVNQAVNEFFLGKRIFVSESCWIYKKEQ